ncbi:hypothetical protein PIB30_088211 [Stylosanthes scabra]|uniref:Putative plant transposon protein domain-containing protein n=1 Tax=Stylosanthes scabra TaxID=79078 RepID=A0ABU6VTA7_9FABA|nr:hypothetical protein [Stylosanthes scabra]
MASSSASYDANRFKSAFHQSLFEDYAAAKGVTFEISFDLAEDEHPEIREQVANHAQLRRKHPYKSYVRGVEVSFSAENITRVLIIIENTPRAETDFITRHTSDSTLDEVLQELCVPGARWKLSTSTTAQPIHLKRQDLFPLARGWHEFIIHSLIPTGNESKIIVARAILIHSIIKGEEVRTEDFIADNIAIIAHGLEGKGNLAFPSTIYRLCKAVGVSMRKFRGTELISMGKPITARMMSRTRGRNVNLQPNQPMEEEDQQQPTHQDWVKD